jgi:CHAT domain
MITQAATVSLEIDIGTRCTVTAEDERDRVVVTSDLAQNKLEEMHRLIRRDLERFQARLSRLRQRNLSNATEALLALQRRGRLVLNTMFPANARELDKITGMCRRAFATWDKPGWDKDSIKPPLITVRANLTSGIPIEILPLFERSTTIRAGNTEGELARVASSFLGFSAVVRRDIGVPPPKDIFFENEPKLPIRMFLDRRMSGARDEEEFFASRKDVDFGRAWPNNSAPRDLEKFANVLAQYLWQPETSFDGAGRKPPDQIFHFACHCNTSGSISGDHTITLSPNNIWWFKSDREITIEMLTDNLLRLRDAVPGANPRQRPFIFLNACGSSNLHPAGTNSFTELFLKNGFGFLGFVGSEATIPDRFASVFAQAFYKNLLDGLPVGQAMHATRWWALSEYKNPLGLLYTLYAEPELQVRVRRPVSN